MINPIALAVACVLMSSVAQIVMKRGMNAVKQADPVATYLAAFTNPYVLLGFFLYGLGALAWLWVLAKVDVGLAYPLVSLGFIVTFFWGVFFLGEPFSWIRLIACLLILLGVSLLALQHTF